MSYIDGFVAPVKTDRKDEYRTFAAEMGAIFKEFGALSIVEAWGDDVPEGKTNSLRSAVLLEADETVVFSWTIWPDKATRDDAWGKMMEDPRMRDRTAPFEGQRIIYGGFEKLLEV